MNCIYEGMREGSGANVWLFAFSLARGIYMLLMKCTNQTRSCSYGHGFVVRRACRFEGADKHGRRVTRAPVHNKHTRFASWFCCNLFLGRLRPAISFYRARRYGIFISAHSSTSQQPTQLKTHNYFQLFVLIAMGSV